MSRLVYLGQGLREPTMLLLLHLSCDVDLDPAEYDRL